MSACRFCLTGVILLSLAPMATAQERPRVDCHGDPLPPGAIGRLGTTRLRHGPLTTEIAFLADGKTLASLDVGPVAGVSLFDRTTGKERDRFRLVSNVSPWATFSPNRELVAWWDGNRLAVYDLASGKRLHEIVLRFDDDARILDRPFCFSGDGRLLVTVNGDGTHADVWEAGSGRKLRKLDLAAETPITGNLIPSPDGKRLAIWGRNGSSGVWDLVSGKTLYAFPMDSPAISPLGLPSSKFPVFAPDGQTLATTGKDGWPVVLGDAATGKQLHIAGQDEIAYNLAFSPDGKTLAIAVANGIIRLWDVGRRKESCTLHGPPDFAAACLSFSRDGRTLAPVFNTLDSGIRVQLWRLPAGKELGHIALPKAAECTGWTLSDDGTTLACIGRNMIHV